MEGQARDLGPERETVSLSAEENEAFEDVKAWLCHLEACRQLSRAMMDVKRNPGASVISWFLARADEMWRV